VLDADIRDHFGSIDGQGPARRRVAGVVSVRPCIGLAALPDAVRHCSRIGSSVYDRRLDRRSHMNRECHVRFCERRCETPLRHSTCREVPRGEGVRWGGRADRSPVSRVSEIGTHGLNGGSDSGFPLAAME